MTHKSLSISDISEMQRNCIRTGRKNYDSKKPTDEEKN
jgi:hypothetical protein